MVSKSPSRPQSIQWFPAKETMLNPAARKASAAAGAGAVGVACLGKALPALGEIDLQLAEHDIGAPQFVPGLCKEGAGIGTARRNVAHGIEQNFVLVGHRHQPAVASSLSSWVGAAAGLRPRLGPIDSSTMAQTNSPTPIISPVVGCGIFLMRQRASAGCDYAANYAGGAFQWNAISVLAPAEKDHSASRPCTATIAPRMTMTGSRALGRSRVNPQRSWSSDGAHQPRPGPPRMANASGWATICSSTK